MKVAPSETASFYFSETLNVPLAFTSGNIVVEGKQNLLFPVGPDIKCFAIHSNTKVETNCEKIVCLTPTGSNICSSFKEHDRITCESQVEVAVPLRSSEFCSPLRASQY